MLDHEDPGWPDPPPEGYVMALTREPGQARKRTARPGAMDASRSERTSQRWR